MQGNTDCRHCLVSSSTVEMITNHLFVASSSCHCFFYDVSHIEEYSDYFTCGGDNYRCFHVFENYLIDNFL